MAGEYRKLRELSLQGPARELQPGLSGSWARVHPEAYDVARGCARGAYQRALIDGVEAVSGSTLRGKAKQWGGSYALSRDRLIARLVAGGLVVALSVEQKGKRILCVWPGRALDLAHGYGWCWECQAEGRVLCGHALCAPPREHYEPGSLSADGWSAVWTGQEGGGVCTQ